MAAYTSAGTYNDAGLNADDKKKVESLQAQWAAYKAAGDTAGMQSAHEQAEAIRSNAGYSGGTDGSEYHTVQTATPYLRGASSQEDYVNKLYDAQREASLAALKTAYDQNVIALDHAAEKIPAQYQTARNQSAASNEIAKANFNEYAAASGLNTGAGGQIQLSMANAEQGNQSALHKAEADALAEIENQRTLLRTNYQNSIAEAIAAGNLERAQALYNEAVRVDNSMAETALNQAQLNFNYEQYEYQKQQNAAKATGSVSSGTSSGVASSEPVYPDLSALTGQQTTSADSLVTASEYKLNAGVSATQVQRDLLSMVNAGTIDAATAYEVMARLGF